ncbi:MsnO8 family LLM class oxidoreductase [Nonomuraea sp. NPDC050478]|uniref:MsnO8 family LLM class oxidoreductase n=1 Tax=Nonomuraea sp. NPDC050478 TaxID=3364365 RepID=UPI0037956A05
MTPLSILDRSLVRQGQSPASALRDTVRFAREAEKLGYHRFWVSEHHSVPGVAGSAPTVLAAAVAAATSRIRVGTGGVMLPNHRPLVVAEQFGVLESLHPARIDMGLGRSVGFTGAQDAYPGVHALPAEGLRPQVFVLAMGAGADIAAAHGLPLVIGGGAPAGAAARYRAAFRPSEWSAAPYVMVAANIAVGETAEQAALLQVPEAWSTAHSRVRGVFPPLRPPGEILRMDLPERERALLEDARKGQISGTADEVATRLRDLVTVTGADEVLVTMNTYDLDDRLESYRRLAALA